jgi:hypothetical protein
MPTDMKNLDPLTQYVINTLRANGINTSNVSGVVITLQPGHPHKFQVITQNLVCDQDGNLDASVSNYFLQPIPKEKS